MEIKKEITAIDYDKLLYLFCEEGDYRPAFKNPNTVGDKTYATDGNSVMIVPNEYLKGKYDPHPKTPNFESVLEQIKECGPAKFKDTDLFKALQVHPKVYDTSPCDECDGDGKCSHCGAECSYCDGEGWIEDKSLPMVYGGNATIQIGDQYFLPRQLGRLEKVVIETLEEEFFLIGNSGAAAKFKVGPVELIICRMDHEQYDQYPNTVLKSLQK